MGALPGAHSGCHIDPCKTVGNDSGKKRKLLPSLGRDW